MGDEMKRIIKKEGKVIDGRCVIERNKKIEKYGGVGRKEKCLEIG